MFKEQNQVDLETIDEWKSIKSTNEAQQKPNFEEQLNREYNWVLNELHIKLKETENKPSEIPVLKYLLRNFSKILDIDVWDVVKIKIVIEFLQSEYYKNIPYVDIESKLTAFLLCSGKVNKIQKSDLVDINFISAYLPIVDLFICDKEKVNACMQLKFNEACKTKVCSISDIDEIMEYLDSQ